MNTKKGKGYGRVSLDFVYLDKIESLAKYRMYTKSYPKNQYSLLLKRDENLLIFDNRGDGDINF